MTFKLNDEILYLDKEDIHLVLDRKWYINKGARGLKYAVTSDGKLMHRIICNTPKGMYTDHVNGNTLDNRRSNLRACTNGQNQANRRMNKNNKSGFKGVVKVRGGKWQAKINKDNIRYSLGYYDNPEEAARAYDESARKLHGQYARLNFT